MDQFIATAPNLPGWKFISLKQARHFDADTEIKSGSATFKLGGLRYEHRPKEGNSSSFTIYIAAPIAKDPEGYKQLCTRLLEDALGERLASTAIHDVQVYELNADSPADLREFINVYKDLKPANAAE